MRAGENVIQSILFYFSWDYQPTALNVAGMLVELVVSSRFHAADVLCRTQNLRFTQPAYATRRQRQKVSWRSRRTLAKCTYTNELQKSACVLLNFNHSAIPWSAWSSLTLCLFRKHSRFLNLLSRIIWNDCYQPRCLTKESSHHEKVS